MKPEDKIVQAIKKYLREEEHLVFRYHGDGFGTIGHPDLYGILSHPASLRGRAFFFEVKAPGEKPRPNQLAMLELIAESGGLAAWVVSVDEVKFWINEWA